jgi:ATP-dependent Clp protease ATP-binding subunit ClpA
MPKKPLSPDDKGIYAFVFQEPDGGWYYREIAGRRCGPHSSESLALAALKEYLLLLQAVDVSNANRVTVEDVIKQMQERSQVRQLPVARGSSAASASAGFASKIYGVLDPAQKTDARIRLEDGLSARVIGQERAIRHLSRVFEIAEAGVSDPDRPLANLLFLGPTGVGKTRVVEAMSEVLFGAKSALVKISCAEFQQHHEIAKILGAPPGYVGFRECKPLITKESLELGWGPDKPHISLLLFDEIEKAAPEMWQLLLGIMDKGEFTMGTGEIVRLARCIVFLTGNVGTTEMSSILSGGMGFSSSTKSVEGSQDDRLYRAAMAAAKRKFPPEFMNRLDKTVVFRTLTQEGLERILDIEVGRVWSRVMRGTSEKAAINLLPDARALLLKEGTDPKFGARPLRRTVERFLLYPLATFMSTRQLYDQCVLTVGASGDGGKLLFTQSELPRIEQLEDKKSRGE